MAQINKISQYKAFDWALSNSTDLDSLLDLYSKTERFIDKSKKIKDEKLEQWKLFYKNDQKLTIYF